MEPTPPSPEHLAARQAWTKHRLSHPGCGRKAALFCPEGKELFDTAAATAPADAPISADD